MSDVEYWSRRLDLHHFVCTANCSRVQMFHEALLGAMLEAGL